MKKIINNTAGALTLTFALGAAVLGGAFLGATVPSAANAAGGFVSGAEMAQTESTQDLAAPSGAAAWPRAAIRDAIRPDMAGASRLRAGVKVSRMGGGCGDALIDIPGDHKRGLLSITLQSPDFSGVAMASGMHAIALWRGGRLVSMAPLIEGGVAYDFDLSSKTAMRDAASGATSGATSGAASSGRWRMSLAGAACEGLDLSANIDGDASFVDFTFDGDDMGLLSALPVYFDLVVAQQVLHVMAPAPDSDATLAALSRIAEYIGSKAGVTDAEIAPEILVGRPPALPARKAAGLPGIDIDALPDVAITLLVGVADDLSGLISEQWMAEIDGPYLGMVEEFGRRVLIVSGKNAAEMEQAAIAAFSTAQPKARAAIVAADGARRTDARHRTATQIGVSDARDRDEIVVNLADIAGGPLSDGDAIRFSLMRPKNAGDGAAVIRIGGVSNNSGGGALWNVRLNGEIAGVIALSAQADSDAGVVRISGKKMIEGRNLVEIILSGAGDGAQVFVSADSAVEIGAIGDSALSPLATWRSDDKGGAWVLVGDGRDGESGDIEAGLRLVAARAAHLAAAGADAASVTLTRDLASIADADFMIGTRKDLSATLARLDAIARRFGGENRASARNLSLERNPSEWEASIAPVAGIAALSTTTPEILARAAKVLSARGVWGQISGDAAGIDLDNWRISQIEATRTTATTTENRFFAYASRKLEDISAWMVDGVGAEARGGRDLRDWMVALAPALLMMFGGALLIAFLLRMGFARRKELEE